MDNKTIYALSTVFGKSGVAVIRISGRNAIRVVEKMTDINPAVIKPRYAYFADLKNIVNVKQSTNVFCFILRRHTLSPEKILSSCRFMVQKPLLRWL